MTVLAKLLARRRLCFSNTAAVSTGTTATTATAATTSAAAAPIATTTAAAAATTTTTTPAADYYYYYYYCYCYCYSSSSCCCCCDYYYQDVGNLLFQSKPTGLNTVCGRTGRSSRVRPFDMHNCHVRPGCSHIETFVFRLGTPRGPGAQHAVKAILAIFTYIFFGCAMFCYQLEVHISNKGRREDRGPRGSYSKMPEAPSEASSSRSVGERSPLRTCESGGQLRAGGSQ